MKLKYYKEDKCLSLWGVKAKILGAYDISPCSLLATPIVSNQFSPKIRKLENTKISHGEVF